jgi:hypothetical protein
MTCDVVVLSRELRDRVFDERLRACQAIRQRFAGRLDLERTASNTYYSYRDRASALAKLEWMLHIIDDVERDKRIVRAYCDDLSTPHHVRALAQALERRDRKTIYKILQAEGDRVGHLVEVECVRQILAKRAERAERARLRRMRDEYPTSRESVLARLPRWQEARALTEKLVYQFRTTRHGHETRILPALRGCESARSGIGIEAPHRLQSIRYPGAYGWRVHCSWHEFYISTHILDKDVCALNNAAPRGILYLSSKVRVRQGRGTSLVVERL